METLSLFHSRLGKIKIPIEEIMYLQSDSNYTDIHIKNLGKQTSCLTLKKIEDKIDHDVFFRINRGIAINKKHLVAITKVNNKATATLSNGLQLPISRRRFNEVNKQNLTNL